DKLRTESEKAVKIETFIEPDALDPVYFSGRTYYLVPDGPIGQRPYVLFHQGMEDEKKCAIAQVVMHGKEQVVLLRPMGKLIAMEMLSFDSQIVKPSNFEGEIAPQEPGGAELDLVKTLIKASTAKKLEFEKYKDTYTDKLTQL